MFYRWRAPVEARPHDIRISDDGTRAYVAVLGYALQREYTDVQRRANGLAILDVSDIQERRPDPQVRVLGATHWEDGGGAQVPIPLRIKGRPYVVFTDWAGPGGGTNVPEAARLACGQGLPPFGFARLIDISDEQHPTVVSKIMLPVQDPANCSAVMNDLAATRAGYSSSMCTPDNPQNASIIACAWKESGLRIFDIRDPSRPAEIAYYKPMGRRSPSGSPTSGGTGGLGDRVIQVPRVDLRQNEVWFMSQESGMQIVRFTEQFRAARKDLFGSR